ncbi:MAG TPA: glycosyltransferase, partial [Caulobacteraceae bacterium]
MRLFQYWDTGSPPDEVAGWIEGFRVGNPGFRHRLYDRDAASWFIGKQVGEREKRAFDAIAVPSMQSDYFRYCAVWALGGIYVDADFQSLAPLSGLLDQAPHSLMLVWDGHMVAGLMMCRQPGDPFV